MRACDRFKAIVERKPFDRLPLLEWVGWWDVTLERWWEDGLPRALTDADDIRRHFGLDIFHQDWFAEYCPIESGSYGSIGTFPHVFKVILFDTIGIWRNGSALYADSVFHDSMCGIQCNLIICFVTITDMQIIIINIHIKVWEEEFILHHLPHDSRHFVTIHLDDGGLNLYLVSVCHISPHCVDNYCKKFNAPPAKSICFCRSVRL